jgi:hypothetical protein
MSNPCEIKHGKWKVESIKYGTYIRGEYYFGMKVGVWEENDGSLLRVKEFPSKEVLEKQGIRENIKDFFLNSFVECNKHVQSK